jgi:hypothetical protein
MQVVALPGRRIETEAWLKSLLEAAQYHGAQVTRYRHWDTGAEADVAFEASRLSDTSPRLVVAKSLGTVIAATAYGAHQFRPAFGIFVGTPYAALEEADVGLLRHFAVNVTTLFIQQAEDPGGTAAGLAPALQLDPSTVAAVPGRDHLYPDLGALAGIVHRWQEQHPGLRP